MQVVLNKKSIIVYNYILQILQILIQIIQKLQIAL